MRIGFIGLGRMGANMVRRLVRDEHEILVYNRTPEKATEIYYELRQHVSAEYDAGGHIGKRYRRQDEIGTPLAITVDHQTLEDDTVTLRDRDTLTQDRVPVSELVDRVTALTR